MSYEFDFSNVLTLTLNLEHPFFIFAHFEYSFAKMKKSKISEISYLVKINKEIKVTSGAKKVIEELGGSIEVESKDG